MKQPPCASGVRLTRLVQAVAVLAAIKLITTAWLWMTPLSQPGQAPQVQSIVIRQALAVSPAQAADTTNATADNATAKNNTSAEPLATPSDPRARQTDLDKREADLRTLERELDVKLENLKKLEASIQEMLETADAARDEKIAHLIDVYSNMKPKQAGQVLETLDETIAVKILAGMSGRKAGEVLSLIDAVKAAKLTELLTKFQTGQSED